MAASGMDSDDFSFIHRKFVDFPVSDAPASRHGQLGECAVTHH
jgi:hypothetical protein